MSGANGTENSSIFQTELKDAKIEPSKLPPLYSDKNGNSSSPKLNNDIIKNNNNNSNSNNNENNISNVNDDNKSNANNYATKTNNNVDENNNGNDDNNENDNDIIESNIKNDGENNDSNADNGSDNRNSQKENNNEQSDIDNKEEIRIDGEETDGLLHEQASALIGAVINQNNENNIENNNENNNSESRDASNLASNTNSQKQSTTTSQKNSTKSTTTNSTRNSLPSNRSSSSLSSHSSGTFRNSIKTSLTKRRIGKLPSSKISYNQEMSKIPKDILHNPYVTKRLNIFPPRKTNPPKAALSNVEYRNRVAPQKDELTEKILNGEKLEEEPTIDQLKNSAHILRNIEKELIDKSQYPEAKKAAEAFQRTLLLIQKKSSSNEVKTGLEDLISKRNELIILADSRKEEWNEAISKHQSDTEAHIRDMKQQHQEKIEKFNTEIPTELTPLFKRNSVSYLTMRSNEKYLALNRHFDEAQKMKLKADEIEEIEREENFSKMDEYYRRKREKMKQLQKLEIVNYINYSNTRKSELIFQKEKSVTPPLLRAERIDREIKRICEKRGIKQNQLNFDLVDDERVKLIKSKEKENEEIFSTSSTKKPQKKSSNEIEKKDDEIKKLEEEEEEEKNQNNDDDDINLINEEEEEEEKNQNNEEDNIDKINEEEEEIVEKQNNNDQIEMEEEDRKNE